MKHIWLNEYMPGVPHHIVGSDYTSCIDMLLSSVEKYGDNPAFSSGPKCLSFTELDSYSRRFATYLQQELLVEKQERIAVMLPNLLQYPISLISIMRLGCITVNVNPQYTPRELAHQLNDSGAKTIIIFANALPVLEQIIDETQIENVIVTGAGDMLGAPVQTSDHIDFMHALSAGEAQQLAPVSISPEDIIFLQYTGGTTGLSKGAVLNHGNLIANISQFKSWFAGALIEGEETYLSPLPLYHIYGMMVNCLGTIALGAHSVLIANPGDPASLQDAFHNWDISVMSGVNSLYNNMMRIDSFETWPFKLKFCAGGGASMQSVVTKKMG